MWKRRAHHIEAHAPTVQKMGRWFRDVDVVGAGVIIGIVYKVGSWMDVVHVGGHVQSNDPARGQFRLIGGVLGEADIRPISAKPYNHGEFRISPEVAGAAKPPSNPIFWRSFGAWAFRRNDETKAPRANLREGAAEFRQVNSENGHSKRRYYFAAMNLLHRQSARGGFILNCT